jgi:hypothetical protein
MVELAEPYARRPVSSLGLWRPGEWRIKRYGISYGRPTVRAELAAAAEAAAERVLPSPAVTPTRYGVGFLGVHDGRGGNFVYVDWWERENELHHHLFFSNADDPGELRAATPDDAVACVWDLAVIGHERDAWVRHVLVPAVPDLDGYLADTLDGTV